MQCRSLGFATDLAILELAGSLIEVRDGYVKVSTPAAPTYYWGNFLLIDDADAFDDVARWSDHFAREFPTAEHVALGLDDPHPHLGGVDSFNQIGADVNLMAVLTCGASDLVERETLGAVVRELVTAADWSQALELGVATRGEQFNESPYRTFFSNYLDLQRSLVDRGVGSWWGVFASDRLVAQCGIINCSGRAARYQMVSTHPDFRRRGFAGAVVSAAGAHARLAFAVDTLVIVADPLYHAISIYTRLGFTITEHQLSVQRTPR
jgi:GNAT superfamily N-acetyltransferase